MANQTDERVREVGDTEVVARRGIAAIVDNLILIFGIAIFVTAIDLNSGLLILFAGVFGQFLYFWILEGLTGRTVGKFFTRIEVVRTDGSPIDFRDSFTRNLVRYIDSALSYAVGFVFVLRSEDNQRLGDRYADTLVVKR